MTTIQSRTRHVDENTARDAVFYTYGTGREVSDGVALTIAAWWQSPGGTGEVLAALASGCRVDVTELLEDIASTRNYAQTYSHNFPAEARALDMLATWALNHDSARD